jgi:hypothetical protein
VPVDKAAATEHVLPSERTVCADSEGPAPSGPRLWGSPVCAERIRGTFERDETPGLHAAFHIPFVELGRRFADVANPHVYGMGDARDMWIHRHAVHAAAKET